MYAVRLEFDLAKICKKYPLPDQKAIVRALCFLETNPRPIGSKKLVGREGYRLRVGHYRIIYSIYDQELLVLVIDINTRADVYKKR